MGPEPGTDSNWSSLEQMAPELATDSEWSSLIYLSPLPGEHNCDPIAHRSRTIQQDSSTRNAWQLYNGTADDGTDAFALAVRIQFRGPTSNSVFEVREQAPSRVQRLLPTKN